MSFAHGTIENYLKALGERKPTPGGGSVAALAGALGAGLAQMVGQYTSGKKYEAVEFEASQLVEQADGLMQALQRTIDEDCTAYNQVSQAMGLPKTTDEDKTARKAAMQEAFVGAMTVPLQTCRDCLALLRLLERLMVIGNRNLLSDVGVAGLMAFSGFDGARFNVEINLAFLKDETLLAETREELKGLTAEAGRLRESLLEKTAAALAHS